MECWSFKQITGSNNGKPILRLYKKVKQGMVRKQVVECCKGVEK